MSTIQEEIQKLGPSAVIELFEVDATNQGAGIFRFHSGTNELNGDIVWQGETYVKYPIEAKGFSFTGQGSIPRPTLTVSNYLSAITTLLLNYNELLGAKVTRKRTLKKYLDAVNFVGGVNPTADPTAEFSDDIYYIDRKASESRLAVEFELASSMDLNGVMLPKRMIIQNNCPWRYRSADCGYTGTDYFKSDDTPTTNSSEDVCGKRISSCKARFGENAELPFGGFAGADLFR